MANVPIEMIWVFKVDINFIFKLISSWELFTLSIEIEYSEMKF